MIRGARCGRARSIETVLSALLLLSATVTAMTASTHALPADGGAAYRPGQPILIAHRGASGYRPEHTLASYALAIDMGADYIEPDVVMTKDGVLVARHENALAVADARSGAVIEATTNVHELPHFASRRATRTIDGKAITGWFSEDFTLAELKTLRSRERIPKERPGNVVHDDQHEVPTLQEVIDLAKAKGAARGRAIGLYIETKHPSYHASIGLPIEAALVSTLEANGLNDATAPVFIQSFEVANLRELRRIAKVKLVQLLASRGRPWDFALRGDARTYADMASAAGLEEIASYADGVGPAKSLVLTPSATPTAFVRDAHAAGLVVHPWTFRAENAFLPAAHRRGSKPTEHGDAAAEILAYLHAGIDGFFTDHPDIGLQALRRFATSR